MSIVTVKSPIFSRYKRVKHLWWLLALPIMFILGWSFSNFQLMDFDHIIGAILWVGGNVFDATVINFALTSSSPEVRTQISRFVGMQNSFYFNMAGFTTAFSGVLLASWDGYLNLHSPMLPFVVGISVLGATLLSMGYLFLAPTGQKIGQLQSQSSPDVPQIQSALKKMRKYSLIEIGIEVIVLLLAVILATS